MKRWLIVVGSVFLVLALAAGGGYWWLSRPVEPATFTEPGPSLESRQRASVVDTALAEYGVTDAIFLADGDAAFVGYEAPQGVGAVDADTTQLAALFAMANAAPDASQGAAVQHVDGVPKVSWIADLDALRAAGEDAGALTAWILTIEKAAL